MKINCHYLWKFTENHQVLSECWYLFYSILCTQTISDGPDAPGEISSSPPFVIVLPFPYVWCGLQPVVPRPKLLIRPSPPHYILISPSPSFHQDSSCSIFQKGWKDDSPKSLVCRWGQGTYPRPHNQWLGQDDNLGFPIPHPVPLATHYTAPTVH